MNKLIKIKAAPGYIYCNPDKTEIFSNEIFLSNIDKEENYIQITEVEAQNIIDSQNEKIC